MCSSCSRRSADTACVNRKLAAVELIAGLLPTTLVYVYFCPLGLFAIFGTLLDLRKGLWPGWTFGSVLALLIIGGTTLPVLWALWLARYRGHGIGGPRWLIVPLILLGSAACVILLVQFYMAEADWYLWYLFVAPLVIVARSTPHTPN